MPQPNDTKTLAKPKFVSLRKLGLGGLVTKGDPQDLEDTQSPDMRNITFDSGIIGPRNGTTLYVAKPVGESGNPSQLLKAKDSNGTLYLIGVFGVNFYLLDPVNVAWIKISPAVLPTQSGLFWGSASWNLGTGSDSFYIGNGVDIVLKWVPILTYLSKAAASADAFITIPDSTLFPSGVISVVVYVGGNTVTLTNNATGLSFVLSNQPSNNQTWTLTINGTTITGAFVTAIGVTAGNVLIGADVVGTLANLLGLLQAPGTTSATQVALSAPNQALVNDFTYASLTTTSFSMTPNSSVYSLTFTTNQSVVTYSNPNNVIAVSGSVGANIPKGTGITNQMIIVPTIPRGNRFGITMASGGGYRLFVAGVPGAENVLYWSQAYDPTVGGNTQELFTGGTGTLTAGFMPIINGEGGIEEIVDFGQYLGIVKANALVQGYFTIDTTDDVIVFNTNPTIYGESIFPVGAHTSPKSSVNITVENALYIVTTTQGIFSYIPASTGAQLSTTITSVSDDILSLFTNGGISFSMGRTEYINRQLLYFCSSINNINNLVLIYDFVWQAWTIWDNLNAVDGKEFNNTLFFLCNDDGGLYFYDPTSQQDARNGQALGYNTYIFTKRFDFGAPANPKQQSMAMVQGYITSNTKLYIDVLYNESGSLAMATYIIDGSNPAYTQQVPVYGIGRASLGQNPIGGAQVGTIGFFRIYLDLLYRAGAHVIQFKIYTSNVGDNWGVTGLAVNPEGVSLVPTELKISSL